ncbi:hypothetical protein HY02_08380 [Peptococcaceae bacterium SCADC1_2_3]|nr:hypothetical protein DK28_0214425 [Peptococcaceae bacterium SCADC1_2_3]KFI35230.1 hypothetical protein HY00_06650 [Peptococcaceae bacterium SCADC1_2_3]KFI38106.1 hypothetical protein HY02_08380 [Peptococcaceae bacterium SCADC1_2_3]HBQ28558.1 hypothetical protein [Desulfotomaculum sp.]HCJ78694.1 hypothetical protein [Desulfotomaculum sp.]
MYLSKTSKVLIQIMPEEEWVKEIFKLCCLLYPENIGKHYLGFNNPSIHIMVDCFQGKLFIQILLLLLALVLSSRHSDQ